MDYFCIVGPKLEEDGSLILEKASVLVRYPLEDKPEMPLPDSPQFFCFPAGMQLHAGAQAPPPEPLASTFIIKHSGINTFGVCLHFYRWVGGRPRCVGGP